MDIDKKPLGEESIRRGRSCSSPGFPSPVCDEQKSGTQLTGGASAFLGLLQRILYLLFKKRDELLGLSGTISEEALWEHVSTLKYAMHSKINRDFTETFPNFNDCDEVTLEMHGFIMNWRPCMAIKYPESSQS